MASEKVTLKKQRVEGGYRGLEVRDVGRGRAEGVKCRADKPQGSNVPRGNSS